MNPRNATVLLLIAGSILTISSCASDQKRTEATAQPPAQPPAGIQQPPRWNPGSRPVAEVVLSAKPSQGSAQLITQQTLASDFIRERVAPTIYNSDAPGELIQVKLAANNAPPLDILRILLTDYLQRDFVIDPALRTGAANAEVSLDIDQEMTPSDIRDLIAGLAMIYDWVLTERDSIVYVQRASNLAANPFAPILEARPGLDSEAPAIRLRQLRHIQPQTAAEALALLAPQATGARGATSTQGAPGAAQLAVGRTMILVGTTRQINRMADLLSALDVPPFQGATIWTYRLAHIAPEAARQTLESLARGAGLSVSNTTAGAADGVLAFFTPPNSDRLMVLSRDPSVQPIVRDLVMQVDQDPTSPTTNLYIYRVQHLDQPTRLQQLVNDLFAGRVEARTGAGAVTGTPNQIRVSVDAEERVVFIRCTPNDFAEILSVFNAIDRPAQQVFVQTVLAEVVLNDRLEYGVEYFLNAFDIDGLGALDLTAGVSTLTGNPTLGAVFTAADGFAVINALENETDVEILSQPSLVVSERQKANFNVGGETPIITGDTDTTTGGLRRNIEYRQTGVTLDVEPLAITESGDVTLLIVQEITAVQAQSDLGPEFTTRRLETTVTVPHGRTLILSGVIENQASNQARKIPLLADIPLVGPAFQSVEQSRQRRELILTLTPRIINTPDDGRNLQLDFLRATEGLRAALHRQVDSLPIGTLREIVEQETIEAAPSPDTLTTPLAPPEVPNLQ